MGERWETAFREHLVRLAAAGTLGDEIVESVAGGATRRRWRSTRSRWRGAIAGRYSPGRPNGPAASTGRGCCGRWRSRQSRRVTQRYAVGAREAVDGEVDVIAVTAADIFSR